MKNILLISILTSFALSTTICYKNHSNCFIIDDGYNTYKILSSKKTFLEEASKYGLDGEKFINDRRGNKYDEHGYYYDNVYYEYPIFIPMQPSKPNQPEKPVTIQPTKNPYFNKPNIKPKRQPRTTK